MDIENDKKVLASSFFYNSLNTIQSIFFGFLTSLLFTKIFGLEILGEFTLVATYITIFFAVITSGILTGFKREAIMFSTTNNNIGNFLFLVYIFTLVITILFSALFFLFEDFIFELLNLQNINYNTLVLYLISHVLFFVPASLLMFTFESFQNIKPLFRISFSSNVIKTIGLVLMVYFTLNVNNAIIVYFLVPHIVISFLSFIHILNNYNFKINFKEIYLSFNSFKNALLYSIKLYPLMIAELIIGNIAIILLSKSHSIESIGVFKILFNYYLVLKFIPEFFGRVINPTLTKLYFEKKESKVLIYYNFFFKLSILVCSCLTIFFVGYTRELLGIYSIYGSEYIICMIILLASNLILTGSMIGGIFQAYNHPEFISLFVGIGSITSYILAIYLIPKYGILGACFSILGSNLISQIGLHYYALKKMKINIEVNNFIFSVVIVFIVSSLIFISNYYNDSLVLKSLLILFMIVIYLIIIKFYGFFNSLEINQLVLFSEKSNNKYLKSIVSYIKIINF